MSRNVFFKVFKEADSEQMYASPEALEEVLFAYLNDNPGDLIFFVQMTLLQFKLKTLMQSKVIKFRRIIRLLVLMILCNRELLILPSQQVRIDKA